MIQKRRNKELEDSGKKNDHIQRDPIDTQDSGMDHGPGSQDDRKGSADGFPFGNGRKAFGSGFNFGNGGKSSGNGFNFGNGGKSSGSGFGFVTGRRVPGGGDDGDGSVKKVKPRMGRYLMIIVLIILAALSASECFYNVTEQQNAVVTMFGKVVRTDNAGLYFKIPYLQSVYLVDITTHGTGIGYTYPGETGNIVDETDGVMITSDFNLLNIDFYLEYKVSDPVAYLYNSHQPEEILHNIALASIRSIVSNYTVDEAMTTGKGQIQADVKTEMMEELEENQIGLSVVNITIQDSDPPTNEIVQAFKSVETAKQGADTARNNALQYQNSQLPSAEAQADKIIQEAQAARSARIAEATGQVSRFNAEFEEYEKYPEITKKRMFFEAMEEILPDLKVIITDGDTQTMLPLESFTGSSASGSGASDSGSTENTAGSSTSGTDN